MILTYLLQQIALPGEGEQIPQGLSKAKHVVSGKVAVRFTELMKFVS